MPILIEYRANVREDPRASRQLAAHDKIPRRQRLTLPELVVKLGDRDDELYRWHLVRSAIVNDDDVIDEAVEIVRAELVVVELDLERLDAASVEREHRRSPGASAVAVVVLVRPVLGEHAEVKPVVGA